MKAHTRTTLHTTLGELIEALYSETRAFLGNEGDTGIVVTFILNDLLTKRDLRGHPRERQLRRIKEVVSNARAVSTL